MIAKADEVSNSQQFKKLLIPGKIGQVLCLGNLTSPDAYLFLRHLAPDFHAVKGDFDVDPFPSSILSQPQNPQTQPGAHPGHNQHAQHTHHSQQTPAAGATAPLTKVINHGRLRMGMMHGHTLVPPGDADALLIAARQMDVDVLLWSGGSHRFEAYEMEGRFFVNPGTATGAMGTGWWEESEEVVPSFVLMDVSESVLKI